MAMPYRDPSPPGSALCPRCGVTLEEVTLADREVHQCAQCGGLWVPPALFNDALVERGLQADIASLQREDRPNAREEVSRPIRCPACRKALRREELVRSSGVVVGFCRRHGVWLTTSDFARIVSVAKPSTAPGDEVEELVNPPRKIALGGAPRSAIVQYTVFAARRSLASPAFYAFVFLAIAVLVQLTRSAHPPSRHLAEIRATLALADRAQAEADAALSSAPSTACEKTALAAALGKRGDTERQFLACFHNVDVKQQLDFCRGVKDARRVGRAGELSTGTCPIADGPEVERACAEVRSLEDLVCHR
jgi:Zn-finger nucleic acid-binding protein